MARGKKDAAAAFTVTPAATAGAGREPTDATADILEEIEDEGQRSPEARIERLDPIDNQYKILDTVDAALVNDAWIRNNYGGGTFRTRVFGARSEGTWGYLKGEARTYRVDSSIPFKGALRDRIAAVAAPATKENGTPTGSSIIDMGMLQLLSGFQENSKLAAQQARDHSTAMMAMMERMAAPRESGIKELIAIVAPIIAPFVASMAQRKDPVELATQIAALSKNGEGNGRSGLSSVREFLEIKELIGDGGGDKGEGGWITPLLSVVEKGLEVLKTESAKTGVPIQQLVRQPPTPRTLAAPTSAGPGTTAPSSPTTSASTPPSSATSTPEATVDEWSPMEPEVARLAQFAQNGADVGDVAATLMLFLPASRKGQLHEMLAFPDLGERMRARFPVIAPYPVWLEEFLHELRIRFGLIDPDAEDGGDDDPASAHAPLPSDGGE